MFMLMISSCLSVGCVIIGGIILLVFLCCSCVICCWVLWLNLSRWLCGCIMLVLK